MIGTTHRRRITPKSKVTITTELPISAEVAGALARRPAMMNYALSPILRMYHLEADDPIRVGSEGSARLWWFGVIPSWTHRLTIEKLDPTEIYTREHGVPDPQSPSFNIRATFVGCPGCGGV